MNRGLQLRGAWAAAAAAAGRIALDRTHLQLLTPTGADPDMPLPSQPVRSGGRLREAIRPPSGRIEWRAYALGGSRVRVWCGVPDDAVSREAVTCMVEASGAGRLMHTSVAVASGDGWQQLRLHLPADLDGEVTIALVSGSDGPSPLAVWSDPVLERRRPIRDVAQSAFAALRLLGPIGLLRYVAHTARQREDDARYRRWLSQHTPTAEDLRRLAQRVSALRHRPRISVIVPVFNTDPLWLRECLFSVTGQVYPDWELCLCDDGSTDARTLDVVASLAGDPRVRIATSPRNLGIVDASNRALDLTRGEFVGFLDHDDVLAPDALAEIALRLDADPTLDIVYTDEDKIDPSGIRSQPHFKPDWSPEQLRSCMYTSHFTVMRRELVIAAGRFRSGYEGSQDYDLMLRAVERTSRIAHIARVLYHWRMTPRSAASSQLAKPWAVAAARRALEDAVRRQAIAAEVLPTAAAGHFRIRHAVRGSPLVSVLIVPSRRGDGSVRADVAKCLEAVLRTTRGRAMEFIVADDAPLAGAAARMLARASHRLVSYPSLSADSVAGRLNHAATRAAGDYLLVLQENVEPIGVGWLDALLEQAQLDLVGAAGAFLLHSGGTVAHAGLVVGAGSGVAPAFHGEPAWTRGHMSNALDVRNCSAVSGACLLTRRSIFERMGGFDETVGRSLFGVDYGLRLRRAGLRVVVTPHARLYQRTGHDPQGWADPEDMHRLRALWGPSLDEDPYYNPNFDRRAATFRLPE